MRTIHLAALPALLLVLSHLWAADADSSRTLRYTVLSNARPLAARSIPTQPAVASTQTLNSTIEGGGPKVAAHYLVGADGFPQRTT